jgi:hypothetical protein
VVSDGADAELALASPRVRKRPASRRLIKPHFLEWDEPDEIIGLGQVVNDVCKRWKRDSSMRLVLSNGFCAATSQDIVELGLVNATRVKSQRKLFLG